MNWLANECHGIFEREARSQFADDPWSVRDRYGSVVANDGDALMEFVRRELRDPSNADQLLRAQELLELERAVLRTFTSCAWFFDDVARIETRQVLRYAARAIELAGDSALQTELLKGLSQAMSNVQEQGSAADLYMREAVPAIDAAMRAAAAAAALRSVGTTVAHVASFDIEFETGRDWNAPVVYTTHRRAGTRDKFSVKLSGDGADLQMAVASMHAPFSAPTIVEISDLPEYEARILLRKQLTYDAEFAERYLFS